MRHIYVCGLLAAAATAQAGEYRPPRLADGQVDLQGVWSHKNITPLERPAEMGSFVITREQAEKLQARILAKSEDLSRPAEPSVYFWDPIRFKPCRVPANPTRTSTGRRTCVAG